MLEGKVETIVANPLQIKYIPGRKTDDIDSEWIAEVCLNGQIKPSYIPCREIRDIRELTRTHIWGTQKQTDKRLSSINISKYVYINFILIQ